MKRDHETKRYTGRIREDQGEKIQEREPAGKILGETNVTRSYPGKTFWKGTV